ncbi:hypothetical protein [Rhodococcus sp. NPDC004095]
MSHFVLEVNMKSCNDLWKTILGLFQNGLGERRYDVRMSLKVLAWVAGIVGVVVIGVFAVVGLVSGWGVGQFGPLAAWVSGALTLAAVSVSLWQANEAKRRALEDAEKAEKRLQEERNRHAQELERASQQTADVERRHQEQLKVQKETRQIESILPIWHAVADTRQWYFAVYKHGIEQAYRGIIAPSASRPHAGRDKLTELEAQWSALANQLDLHFERALLLNTQKNVVAQLEYTYRDFLALGDAINATLHSVGQHTPPNTEASDALVKNMANHRRIMLQLMRFHLTQSPPITFRSYEDLLDRSGPVDPTAEFTKVEEVAPRPDADGASTEPGTNATNPTPHATDPA